jgi:hypothetical protein
VVSRTRTVSILHPGEEAEGRVTSSTPSYPFTSIRRYVFAVVGVRNELVTRLENHCITRTYDPVGIDEAGMLQ